MNQDMNQKMVKEELEKLESNPDTQTLYHFLDNQQGIGEELSELFLDILHAAFVSGFTTAVKSVISSMEEKSIE